MDSHLLSFEQASGIVMTGVYTFYFLAPFMITLIVAGSYFRRKKRLKLNKAIRKANRRVINTEERSTDGLGNGAETEKIGTMQFDNKGMIVRQEDK